MDSTIGSASRLIPFARGSIYGGGRAGMGLDRGLTVSVIEVAIGPDKVPGRFRVDVVNSPDGGEASVATRLDVAALLALRDELQQAVLASTVPSRKIFPEERLLRQVGHTLFAALLGTGEVAGRYRAAAAVAAERGEELRVLLRVGDPALACLPWEAMFDEVAGTYVCRRHQLVRHVGTASAVAPLTVDLPLRILGVVSSPRGLPDLDVEKERAQLELSLAGLIGEGFAEVGWAPSAIWADLQNVLLGGTWHVVHFIGHGDFDHDRDEGVLALTGENGQVDPVEASRLVDLLGQAHPVPRLVVLNSCSGAAAGVTDLFSGTAAALVRGGVTAVTAMQYEISDSAAAAFARGFYNAIAHGRGVDQAVSSGRVGIVGMSGRTLEWVTPVLYLRGHSSRLFTVPADRVGHDVRREDDSSDLVANPAREQAAYQAKAGGQPHAHSTVKPTRYTGLLSPGWESRLSGRQLKVALDAGFWRMAVQALDMQPVEWSGIALVARSMNAILILGAVFPRHVDVTSLHLIDEFSLVHHTIDELAGELGIGQGDVNLTWVHTHPRMGAFMSGADQETARQWRTLYPEFIPIVIDTSQQHLDKQIGAFDADGKQIRPMGIVDGLITEPAARRLKQAILSNYEASHRPKPLILISGSDG
jgi:CHAT domain